MDFSRSIYALIQLIVKDAVKWPSGCANHYAAVLAAAVVAAMAAVSYTSSAGMSPPFKSFLKGLLEKNKDKRQGVPLELLHVLPYAQLPGWIGPRSRNTRLSPTATCWPLWFTWQGRWSTATCLASQGHPPPLKYTQSRHQQLPKEVQSLRLQLALPVGRPVHRPSFNQTRVPSSSNMCGTALQLRVRWSMCCNSGGKVLWGIRACLCLKG